MLSRAENNKRVHFVGLILILPITLIALVWWVLTAPVSLASDLLAENAAILYVSPAGTGTAYSQATPCQPQTAVNNAAPGDTIHAAQGTYNFAATLIIDKDVTLTGGFDAILWTPDAGESIFDGQGSVRVIHIQSNASPTIEKFTIRNGIGDGAGIYNEGTGSPIIQNNLIYNNINSGKGGGLVDKGSAFIYQNQIYQNQANLGAGIYVENGASDLTQVLFNEINNNSGIGANSLGGGIYVYTGTGFIEGNDIHNNSANFGGGYFSRISSVTLQNNLFHQNSVSNQGGGLYLRGDSILWNNTVAGNNANTSGGGIYVESVTGSSYQIRNTIIATNTGGVNNGFHSNGGPGTITGAYNNIVGNSSNDSFTNAISGDPRFVNFATFNLHILPTSSDRNSGDPATPGTVNIDIDGEVRPNEGSVDVGADEYYPATPAFNFDPLTPNNQYVDRGTTALFDYYLENTGNVDDSYTFTCSSSPPLLLNSCPGTVNLNAGNNTTVQASFDVPSGANPLDVSQISVIATSQLSPTLMDEVVLNAIVRPLAGLEFEPNVIDALAPGEIITVTHLLTNTGDAADTFTIELIEGEWAELLPTNNFPLPLGLGETAEVEVRITVPPFAESGIARNTIVQATSAYDLNVFDQVTTTITAEPTFGTRYVRASNSTDTDNNCTQSNMPCATIAHAVGQASTNDEIRVAAGNYQEDETAVIPATVFLSGGWNNSFNNQGDPDDTVITTLGSLRVFRILAGSNNKPVISNLTIANQIDGTGGAVFVEASAQPRFESVVFRDSQGTLGGALYANTGAQVTLRKSVFMSNTATIQGGAIYLNQATLSIRQSRFMSNTALTSGGAIYAKNSFVASENSLFFNNSANTNGGAWVAENGSVTEGNDTIVGNTAVNNGAAFYNNNGTVAIRNTIVTANTSGTGAVIFETGAAVSTQLDFNDYFGNNPANTNSIPVGANSIFVDPTFADAEFHLALGSPAIDTAGMTSLEEDFEDDFRPSDQGYDIGYDEVTGCRAKRGTVIYGSIQAAVDALGTGNLIRVTGICRGVNNVMVGGNTISQTVRVLTESLTIQGGWNNDFSDRNLQPTYVDPEGRGRGFYIAGGINVTIDDLIVVHGDATNLGGGPSDEDAGGAVYVLDSTVTLTQTSLVSSTAVYGGGFYNHMGNINLVGFAPAPFAEEGYLANTASSRGGALYNNQGTMTIDGARIRANSASDGGGFYHATGSLTVINTVFSENQASDEGGGLYNSVNATLLHNTFVSNTAVTNGGALYNVTGSSTVRSSIFQGNEAAAGSAIFFPNGSTPNEDYNYYYPDAAPVSGFTVGANSIISTLTEPGLVDVGDNDFHLFDNAPAVDAGDPASPVDHDFEWDLRPSNQSTDMGADEVAGCLVWLNGVIYGSLQAAVDAAQTGDEIRVSGRCSGVHQFDTGGGAGGCGGATGIVNTLVQIDVSVTLLGGWNDTFTNRNEVTELDALQSGRVIHITPGITPTIDGFDILQGALSGSNGNGAGICIDNSEPTITNNRIYSNTATNGAAVYSLNSAALIEGGNRIFANTATSNGGAVFATGVTATTVQNNFVYENTAVNGAAFYNANNNHQFWHNTIITNTATGNGSGLYSAAGAPIFHSNIVVTNTAPTAVFGAGGSPDVDYNNFFGNTGTNVGGTAGSDLNAQLVDPELGPGFTLVISSPVVDKGDPTALLTVDFEDDIRPSHQGFDIGADEVGGCYARIVGDPNNIIYGSVQRAVDVASAGDTVQVDGTCYGVNNRLLGGSIPVTQTLFINKSLTLDGAWNYKSSLTATLHALDRGRVVYIASGAVVTMTDFTLRHGDASLGGLANSGGGIFNDGTLVLQHAQVMRSSAANGGGVINEGTLTLENVNVAGNTAVNGAGFYNNVVGAGDTIIIQSRFNFNQASSNGGGIYQNEGDLFVNGNRVFDNFATQGGGFYLTGGTDDTLDVRNNFIYENAAGTGGGLYNNNTNVNLWHNTFVINDVGQIYSANGDPDIRNNIVDGVDNLQGVGIHVQNGSFTIDFNNVFGNSPNYGGLAVAGSGDIHFSPLYVDRANDDYHLLEDSRGVDEGSNAVGVPDDIDGDLRPTNIAADMGADEIATCLIRVIDPTNGDENLFGVLQDAINFAEGFAPGNLPTVEMAHGECKGVNNLGGTMQVGYVSEDLTFIGSLTRDFTVPGDYYGITTIINAEQNGRVLFIANNASPIFQEIAFVEGNAYAAGGGSNDGGAIYNNGNGRLELYDTYTCGSQADNGGGYYGGPNADLYLTGKRVGKCFVARLREVNGNISIYDVDKFSGNHADGNGGGVYVAGDMDIVNVQVNDNTADGSGGGLYNAGTAADNMIINGIFYSNTAQLEGGGIFNNGPLFSMYHNTIRENIAQGEGGGVRNSGGSMIMNSTVVVSNTSVTGNWGGLNSVAATLDYNNFFDNMASGLPANSNIPTGPNSISADPKFCFGCIWTFKINSPNIDTADPALLPANVQAVLDQISATTAPSAGYNADIQALTGDPLLPTAIHTDLSDQLEGGVTVGIDAILTIRPDGGTDHTGTKLGDIGAFEWWKDFGCAVLPNQQGQTAVPGQTVTYTFNVENVGNPYPPSNNVIEHGYYDVLTITLASETNPWGTLIGGDATPLLDWYESVPITLVVTVPTMTVSAVDTAVIRCQSAGMPNRTRTATAVTNVGFNSNIIVEPDNFDSALPGDVITYTHDVTNTGNETGEFVLIPNSGVLGLSVAELVQGGATVDAITVTLDANESITTLLRVTIQDTAGGGETATPGLTGRSTTDPDIEDSAIDIIDIGYITGTRYVAAVSGDDLANNCTVATFPCATIQHAVDQAAAGDDILVATGVYTSFITRTMNMEIYTQTLFINKSVNIYGGYTTNEIDPFTTVAPITNVVRLSGEDNRRVIHIVDGITVTISNLFIQDGLAQLVAEDQFGGGIYNAGANLTLNGVWLVDNAAQFGGALYHISGDLTIYNSVFANNSNIPNWNNAVGEGGGLYVVTGEVILENNTFASNRANEIGSLVNNPSLLLTSVFTTGNGGALYQNDGNLRLVNNIFANNSGNMGSAAYISSSVSITNDYNLYYNDSPANPMTVGLITGTNSVISDPVFIDGFYHIGATSGAKDTGSSNVTPQADFELDARPQPQPAGLYDIGADERLQIASFVFEPMLQAQSVDPNGTVTYTHYLTNTGDPSDSYMFSMNSLSIPPGGGWTYSLPPAPTGVLDSGESVSVTFVITAGPLGGYVDVTTITAVSAASGLTKTVTDTTTISSTAGVDIEPPQAGSGGPATAVTYQHIVTNTGDGIDQFLIQAINDTPLGWTITIQPTQTAYLMPTASTDVTVTVLIPPGTLAGVTHTVEIEALAQNPDASDSITDTTTVLAGYALRLEPDNTAAASSPSTIVYTHVLTNEGNIQDTITLTVGAAPGSPPWVLNVSPTQVVLDPLMTASVVVTVAVPSGVPGGMQHVAVVTATSSSPALLQVTALNTTTIGVEAGVIIAPDAQMQIVDAGTVVTYTHTVTNLGNVADVFTVTTTSSQGWFTAVSATQLNLTAGQTTTLAVTVTVPVTATPGMQDDTIITVTSGFDPGVSDSATDSTRVIQEHGLLFEPDRTMTVTAPTTVVYTHYLTNTGNGPDTFQITANSSQGWAVQTPANIDLDPGVWATVLVTLTVPGTAGGQTDVTVVTATSTISSATFANVTDTTIVTGTAGTAGVVIEPDNAGPGVPGATIQYQHIVTNTGSFADTFTLDVTSSLSWTVSVNPTNIKLPADGTAPVTVTVMVPAAAVSGTTDVTTVTVASTSVATATDQATDTTYVGFVHDLQLVPDRTMTATADSIIVYTHTLTNAGSGTENVLLTAVSDHGWPTQVDSPVTLALGESTTIYVTMTVPIGASGLTDTMTVTAVSSIDPTATASVLDTTIVEGEAAVLGITITPDNTGAGLPGVLLTYNHTATNSGAAIEDFVFNVASSAGWAVTVTPGSARLVPNQSVNVQVTVQIPATAVVGQLDVTTVTAVSLSDNSIFDAATDRTTVTDETAGPPTIYLPFIARSDSTTLPPTPTPTPTVGPSPTPGPTPTSTPGPTACSPHTNIDLIVTNIQVQPAAPVAGQPATIFVTIKNQGSVNVPYGNNFYLDFYADRVPAPLLIGDIFWGVQGDDLNAGTSKTFSGQFTFTGGTHLLYAQVDTDNTVNECPNEGNNVLGPVTLAVTGAVSGEKDGEPPVVPPDTGPRGTPTLAAVNDEDDITAAQDLTATPTPTFTPTPGIGPEPIGTPAP